MKWNSKIYLHLHLQSISIVTAKMCNTNSAFYLETVLDGLWGLGWFHSDRKSHPKLHCIIHVFVANSLNISPNRFSAFLYNA